MARAVEEANDIITLALLAGILGLAVYIWSLWKGIKPGDIFGSLFGSLGDLAKEFLQWLKDLPSKIPPPAPNGTLGEPGTGNSDFQIRTGLIYDPADPNGNGGMQPDGVQTQ